MSTMPFLRLWILVSAFASATGWVLSGLNLLNRAGYAAALAAGLGLAFFLRRPLLRGWRPPSRRRFAARFRRPLPALFLLLAGLVCLGGALYAPTNYDGATYRLPRVLCWLADEHWSWLHTPIARMNDRSCGFEWLMAPLLLFTRSTRGLFLLNWIPLLLLPALFFSVLTRLGIARRAAAAWMWLAPAGYGYLLQAGGIGNDAYAAAYGLAAVDFALRAAQSRSFFDAALSVLAVALLGGAKTGNLPLMLPWLIVFLPAIPSLLRRPAPSLLVLALATVVSFLPVAILNQLHCGDWTGAALEPELASRHPWAGLLGNSLMLVLGNFVPPFFPLASWWNGAFLGWLPEGLSHLLASSFQPGFHKLGEIPTEENAGLGFGVCVLLVVSWVAAGRSPAAAARPASRLDWLRRCFLAGAFIALFVLFVKSAMMTLPRLLAAYYPLLLPAFLGARGQAALARKLWWRRLAIGLTLLAVPSVMLTPARPLWPANTCLSRISPNSPKLLRRAKEVYATYGGRADTLAPLRAMLPADCRVVGFLGTKDDSTLSLWYPLGSKRVEYILPQEPPERVRARGIQFAAVNAGELAVYGDSIDAWLRRFDAEVIGSSVITAKLQEGPKPWYVVKLRPQPSR